MLNIKFIRQQPEKIKKMLIDRQMSSEVAAVDKLIQLDKKRVGLIQQIDKLRAERNRMAKKDTLENRRLGKQIKEKLKQLSPQLNQLEKEFKEILYTLPNIPSSETPIGKDESDNVIVRHWGKKPKFDFKPKDHLEIGKNLDLIDFSSGAKVTGSQFYFLKNDAVLLELALARFALDFLLKEGFTLWFTPDLARSYYYLGTGYLPKGPEAQIYTLSDHDLGLIATSEITLAGIHAGEVLEEKTLPKKYAGYSHCFRVEAGGYGKYSKGLYRVHQFTKVEMFIYCPPEESEKMHLYLLSLEEKIYQQLGIPYRVLEMCTADLGSQAARKFDVEAWMPGRGDYGEVTSTSNCTDFQARRLNVKFRRKDGMTEFVHMLNGTAIATSRTIIAILENYQKKDGSLVIPKVLRSYVGKDKITQ